MADHPILFSCPMIRALLAGTKTQTRRVIKPQPREWQARVIDILPPSQDEDGNWGQVETVWSGPLIPGMCEPDHDEWHPIRHHRVGDRLYVREGWRTAAWLDKTAPLNLPHNASLHFEADDIEVDDLPRADGRLRPSIHMPRWASRLTLTIADVRVQRLQDISEEDAVAEGCPGRLGPNPDFPDVWDPSPVEEYRNLWNTINGPGSWEANPWVAAYTFTVARGNIDHIRGRE